MDKIVNSEKMNFTFEGGYEVDALTVSKTIESFVGLVSETAKSIMPDCEVRLSISALRPGSLEIIFNTIAEQVSSLLSPENLSYASLLLGVILSIFKIKEHLKGQKPKEVKQKDKKIVIKNQSDKIIEAPKETVVYFNNLHIDQFITNIFNSVNANETVSGINISTESGHKVNYPRDSFAVMSAPIDLTSTANIQTYTRKEILYIKKPDLLGDSMWEFQSDKRIPAVVKDEVFLDKIHKRQVMVGAGTSLEVELQVEYEIGTDGFPIEKSSRYTVLKVLKVHQPEEGQTSLFS